MVWFLVGQNWLDPDLNYLVTSSFLLLVVRPGAPSSFLLLLVRHLLLEAMHLLVIDVNDTCTFLQQSPFQRTFIFQLRPSRDCYVRLEQAIGLSLDVEFSPSSGALSIILPSNTFNVLGLEASASKVVIYWSIKCQAYTSEETTLNSPIPEETSLFI